jgi:flagellar protein FlgJ
VINNVASTPAGGAAPAADKKKQLEAAAKAFEAVFMRQMIGSMRQAKLTSDEDNPLGGGSAADQFRDLQDARLADSMVDKGGFGIAQMLTRQFRNTVGNANANANANASGNANGSGSGK